MKEEYKGAIIVTKWGKEDLGMSHFALTFPRVRYEDKEQDDSKDH